MKLDDSKSNLASHIILLTVLFLILQLSLVTINIASYLDPDYFKNRVLVHDLFTTTAVWWPLVQFIFYQCLLYGVLGAAVLTVARLAGEIYRFSQVKVYYLGIFFWLVTISIIVLANSLLFPHSFFAIGNYVFSRFTNYRKLIFLLLPLLVMAKIVLGLTLWHSFKKLRQNDWQPRYIFLTGTAVIFGLLTVSNFLPSAPQKWRAATPAKPNIIIIGIDGLRPDFVNAERTPNIYAFMHSSINFTNAYSPIAQTFPAWVAILTGTGPKINGARENLPSPENIKSAVTLASHLQMKGYATIFATDDARFITINKQMGFNRLVTPRGGAAEMIIASFDDFPLSNLFINTALGKHMFPFSYGNHESSVTYLPANFLQLINDSLKHTEDKPLFLAAHLNMSGWPFGWARSKSDYAGAWYGRYREGVHNADHQFGELINILRSHNLLKNTVLVVLSDHGVTLGLPNDRAINEINYQGDKKNIAKLAKAEYLPELKLAIKTSLDTSYGYGGDLLSLKQNHVVLAIKGFDVALPKVPEITTQSSLLDIAPMLLAWLNDARLQQPETVPLFLETSNSSTVGVPIESMLKSMLSQTSSSYSYDARHNQIFLQLDAEKKLLPLKQYGILAGQWLLAAVPGEERLHGQTSPADQAKIILTHYNLPTTMVLLDTASGKWTTELNSAWARTTPVKELCRRLMKYYSDDMNCPNCCKV